MAPQATADEKATAVKLQLCEAIDGHKQELHGISKFIWDHPELFFQEKLAHDKLTDFLSSQGFSVKRSTPLETSFIAYFGDPSGIKVGILCEYDALPGIGHACGHNLIAEAGLAAALGLKHFLVSNPSIKAQVIVYGTPAEEDGGGKVLMIEKGVFDEADFCMMVHPCVYDFSSPPMLAAQDVKIVYSGKASHASCAPWEGINALDAAVQCYTAVSMMRQQLKPTDKIHGIITNGGAKPNVIPETSAIDWIIRAPTKDAMNAVGKKLVACAEAAALSTGCTLEVKYEAAYHDLISNPALAAAYQKNAEWLGVKFDIGDIDASMTGSTDMGNVSYVKPSIHPVYSIPTIGVNHTKEFTTAAGADTAQQPTLIAGKALALTAMDVIKGAVSLTEVTS